MSGTEVTGRRPKTIMETVTIFLARNRQTLNGKIARGIAQLDRGESLSPEDARARLGERKSRWVGGNGGT